MNHCGKGLVRYQFILQETVITTLDITTEGFGYMLAFGDLTWVPFVFSLQTRFLFLHPQHSASFSLLIIVLANCKQTHSAISLSFLLSVKEFLWKNALQYIWNMHWKYVSLHGIVKDFVWKNLLFCTNLSRPTIT